MDKQPTPEQIKNAEDMIDQKSAEVNQAMDEWERQHKIDSISRKLSQSTALVLLLILTIVFLYAIDHIFGFKFAVFLTLASLLVKIPEKG